MGRFRGQYFGSLFATCLQSRLDGRHAAEFTMSASGLRHGDGGHSGQGFQPIGQLVD